MKINFEWLIGCGFWIGAAILIGIIREVLLLVFNVDGTDHLSDANRIISAVSMGLFFVLFCVAVVYSAGFPKLSRHFLRFQQHGEKAVEVTRQYFHRELDFSDNSIRLIDEACDELEQAWPPGKTEESVRYLSAMWGYHIGHMLWQGNGSQWTWIGNDAHTEGVWVLRKEEITISPVEKVAERIVNGAEGNSLEDYYQSCREKLMGSPPTGLTRVVVARRRKAIEATRQEFHYELNYSEESIKLIDKACDAWILSGRSGDNPETVEWSNLWGCYIGGIVGYSGGTWEEYDCKFGEVLALRKSDTIVISPIEKVRERLIDGSDENLWDYYLSCKKKFKK